MKSLRETIEMLMEKLYAGFSLYAALSLQFWVVVLALYLYLVPTKASSFTVARLEFNVVYWAGAMTLSTIYAGILWRRYLARLAAMYRTRKHCKIFEVLWPASFIVALMSYPLIATTLGDLEAAISYAILLAITGGACGEAIAEACWQGWRPGPMIVTASLLVFSSLAYPLIVLPEKWAHWLFAMSSIMLSYSIGALLYVNMALRRIA